ncbi:MAG: glycosyltransferase, partial [Desulfobacteraceae bacterium]|nr:glycosyltransferase [Desulfobacteraceae bacterium]
MEKAVIILSSYIFLYPLLMSFVWMIGGLLFYWRHESGHRLAPALTDYPMFSVLVPCHNEENQIGDTIGQLLKLEYPNYEIIAIDDGSSDWTAKIIKSLCNEYDRVRGVYLKENRGKAGALNIGTLVSRSEFIVTLDADALLSPDALYWMAWHFEKYPRVGAVTGNPRVINRSSLLGRIQIGEYATIIGLIKRTQR